MLCIVYLFFFFKQNTAYEMRISDWSSDVCSSELGNRTPLPAAEREPPIRELEDHRPIVEGAGDHDQAVEQRLPLVRAVGQQIDFRHHEVADLTLLFAVAELVVAQIGRDHV